MIQLRHSPTKEDHHIQEWKQQIPIFEGLIKKCVKIVKHPLRLLIPQDFDERIAKFKESLSDTKDNFTISALCEQHVDLIIFHIEGQQNKSIIEVATILEQKYGKPTHFWQNKVYDYANYEKYTQEFSQWETKKEYFKHLYLTPDNKAKIQKFRKLARTYIESLVRLVKKIKKAEHHSDLQDIDLGFRKFKQNETKYAAYAEEVQIRIEEDGQISQNIGIQAKNNAKKTLFNFIKPQKAGGVVYNMLPLTDYRFEIFGEKDRARRPSSKKRIPLYGKKLQMFEEFYKNIGKTQEDMKSLREEYQTAYKEEVQKNFMKTQQNYICTYDKYDYFFFEEHPVNMKVSQAIDLSKPYEKFEMINYEVGSDDQYCEILGQSVSEESEQERDDTIRSGNSFVVDDDYFSSDEGSQNSVKIAEIKKGGQRWSFHSKKLQQRLKNIKTQSEQVKLQNQLELSQGYDMIPIFDGKVKELPFGISHNLSSAELKILKQKQRQMLTILVNGKTKKEIFDEWGEMKARATGTKNKKDAGFFSKKQIQEFMKTECIQERQQRYKVIYIVKSTEVIREDREASKSKGKESKRKSVATKQQSKQQPKQQPKEPKQFKQPKAALESKGAKGRRSKHLGKKPTRRSPRFYHSDDSGVASDIDEKGPNIIITPPPNEKASTLSISDGQGDYTAPELFNPTND